MTAGPILIVGWRERVGLPEFGLTEIRCKIDTGARSSALHADKVKIIRKGGRKLVRFTCEHADGTPKRVEARLHEMRWVKSSNGQREHRPLVRIELELGGVRWTAEVTLTTRTGMEFPLLLGRESLQGRFLIDPQRSYIHARRKKKVAKKKVAEKKVAEKKVAKKKVAKKKVAKKKVAKKKAAKKKVV